jgi:nucleoid-associated protein YgaU
MNKTPIAIFTSLAVAAAGALGYVTLMPAPKPAGVETQPVIAAPVAKTEVIVPKPVEAAPAQETKIEEKKPAEQVVASASTTVKVAPAEPAEVIAPSFDTVRVETGGEAVIAGRAEPDTEVVAKLNGEVVATAKSNADGAFVMIPDKPLPAGTGTLSLETKQQGEVQVSEATVAVAVKPHGQGESTVAVLAPNQPTKILQAPASPSNSVVLDAVDYDAAGNIVFSGRAQPGATIRLYVDNAISGEINANDQGKWNYAGTAAMKAGTHMLRADEIGTDGKVKNRVEQPFMRETAATVAAAAEPAPAPAIASEPAKVTAVAETAPQPTKIVIQPGNNLWTISRELYGAGINYTVIFEANKDQIRDAKLIYPGQIITAPVKTP